MKKSAQWWRTLTGIPDYIEGRPKWKEGTAAVPTHHICSERQLLKGTKLKVGRKLALSEYWLKPIRIKLGLLLEIYSLDILMALNSLENMSFSSAIAVSFVPKWISHTNGWLQYSVQRTYTKKGRADLNCLPSILPSVIYLDILSPLSSSLRVFPYL